MAAGEIPRLRRLQRGAARLGDTGHGEEIARPHGIDGGRCSVLGAPGVGLGDGCAGRGRGVSAAPGCEAEPRRSRQASPRAGIHKVSLSAFVRTRTQHRGNSPPGKPGPPWPPRCAGDAATVRWLRRGFHSDQPGVEDARGRRVRRGGRLISPQDAFAFQIASRPRAGPGLTVPWQRRGRRHSRRRGPVLRARARRTSVAPGSRRAIPSASRPPQAAPWPYAACQTSLSRRKQEFTC